VNVWRHKTFSPVPAYLPSSLKSVVLRTRTGACWRIMSEETVLASGTAHTKTEAMLRVRQAKKELSR